MRVALDASPATRDTRMLLFASNLNPYVAHRDKFRRFTIGWLFSKLYPYTRPSLSMTCTRFHITRISCFLRVVPWLFVHVTSFYSMTSHQKSSKIHYVLSHFWSNKIPGENWLLPINIKLEPFAGNDGVPHKALGIPPVLFHRWSTTRLLHKKKYPYTVLHCNKVPCTTTLLSCTLLYCTVPYCTVLY